MKPLAKLIIASFIIISFSCGDDEDGPSYEFKNQTLQGVINGKDWTYVDGNAEVSTFNSENLSISLGAMELEDPCDVFFIEGLTVIFEVKNEVALTELSFNFDDGGQTITLFDPEGTNNLIATAGAVEILEITESIVRGRIDALYEGEEEAYVNGNFTATFCPEE